MTRLLGSNPWRGNAISRVFGTLFYSTEVLPSSSTLSESLSRRILQNRTRRASMVSDQLKGVRCYNTMLTLYSQMGKYRKLVILVKEIEEKGIGYNLHTLTILLNSYAATSDIDRMEKLLLKMEADPLVTMDWLNYNSAANAFLRVGLREKHKHC
ncbi:hypothetical protein M0R45_009558 [Rubus argutus]|uniref:Pentatricopeptide repeat-containing protein n=1 Tax=Rubus argutus TaxID=59490 RepID=A0AAW1Y5C8_RUBAR